MNENLSFRLNHGSFLSPSLYPTKEKHSSLSSLIYKSEKYTIQKSQEVESI